MGIIESLDECTTNASILRNQDRLRQVQSLIVINQELYGMELEKYTFDDDGTGQVEIERLESKVKELLDEERELKSAIHRLRILEKYIAKQATKRHGQSI